MAFTYDTALGDNRSLVRFHIGDRDDRGHYLDDGEIDYWIAQSSTLGLAVVRCIQYIIAQLSRPDFKQDWMSVSNAEARKGYETLLRMKSQEFGVSVSAVTASSSVSTLHRADSYEQDEDGAYEAPDGLP